MLRGSCVPVCVAVAGLAFVVPSARAEDRFEGKTIAEWITQLTEGDAALKWKAAVALGKTGAAGKAAIPALTEALEDKSGPVRKAAEDSLKKIQAAVAKENPASVKPKVDPAPTKTDPSAKVEKTQPSTPDRSPAGGPGAGPAVEKLLETLRSGKDPEKVEAAKELGEYGEDAASAATALCELSLRSNPALRLAAVRALEKVHPNLYPHVQMLLASDDPKKHIEAAAKIAQMGRGGAPAVPVLMDHLYNPHPARRGYSSARGAVWSGEAAATIVETDLLTLVSIAGDDRKVVKFLITQAQNAGGIAVRLPGPRPNDRDAVYQIETRTYCAAAVAMLAVRIPETRDEIKPLLVRFLAMGDREPYLAVCGLKGLAGCGSEAKDAIPQIKALTRHSIPVVREWAFQALQDIGEEGLVTGGTAAKELQILGNGSGFVVGPNVLMTNVHVIDGEGRVMVALPKVEKPVSATVIARHPTRDIALIRVNLPEGVKLTPLPVADQAIRRGEDVAVLGYPLADIRGSGLKLTKGVVTAIPEKANDGMLLMDAKANPGNSGGPVCDAAGNVVGMLTAGTANNRFESSYSMAIPGTELAAMLRRSLKDYTAPALAKKELKWADVDAAVSPSVLMILKVK